MLYACNKHSMNNPTVNKSILLNDDLTRIRDYILFEEKQLKIKLKMIFHFSGNIYVIQNDYRNA